jgi:anti-sigma factor RsiW
MEDFSCERCIARLGDYFEGQLAAGDRAALEHHLRACRTCAEIFEEYRRIPEMARGATDDPMPLGARARLRRLLSHVWRRHR